MKQTKKTRKEKKKSQHVNLLGREFEIIWKEPQNPEHDSYVDLDKRKIVIDPQLNKKSIEECVIHEFFHVFSDYFNMSQDEIFINGITSFVLDLNKKLKDIK